MQPAAWQTPDYRDRLARSGHRWPSLGEQYQMREILTDGLRGHGYAEHPTMYFARDGRGPETWKSIMVDQHRQEAEVAIGLGESSSCRRSEAITEVDWRRYAAAVDAGRIPVESATAFTQPAREARAVKMALTTLQPLRDELHQARFEGSRCSPSRGAGGSRPSSTAGCCASMRAPAQSLSRLSGRFSSRRSSTPNSNDAGPASGICMRR